MAVNSLFSAVPKRKHVWSREIVNMEKTLIPISILIISSYNCDFPRVIDRFSAGENHLLIADFDLKPKHFDRNNALLL